MNMKIGEIRETLRGSFDSVGYSRKENCFIARAGYFYRHGNTPEKYANYVKAKIPAAVIIDSGDHWTPFRGGASLANSSHFYVKFQIPDAQEQTSQEQTEQAKEV